MFYFKLTFFFISLFLLHNSVTPSVLLFPNQNETEESTSVINNLVAAFRNAENPIGNETPIDFLIKQLFLIFDIFTTASGSYFISSGAYDIVNEKQHQVIAIASTNMMMKLPYMIEIEDLFFNASQFTLASLLLNTSMKMENIHKILFNNIEVLMKDNSTRYEIYNQEKRQVELQNLSHIAEGTIDLQNIIPVYAFQKLITMLKLYPRLLYFFVHVQFAVYAIGAKCTSQLNASQQLSNYAIAQSLVLLANEPKIGDKVQELYDKALRKTVQAFKYQFQAKSGKGILDADQILFPTIERVFSCEPRLNVELSKIKNDLEKKKTEDGMSIAKST